MHGKISWYLANCPRDCRLFATSLRSYRPLTIWSMIRGIFFSSHKGSSTFATYQTLHIFSGNWAHWHIFSGLSHSHHLPKRFWEHLSLPSVHLNISILSQFLWEYLHVCQALNEHCHMPQSLFVILHQHKQVQPFPTFANKGVIHLMESRTLSIFHKYIGTIQTQSTLGHLPYGSEDIGSSQSASATLGMLPLLPPEYGRHSSSNQASAATFPSGHLALCNHPSGFYNSPSQSRQ